MINPRLSSYGTGGVAGAASAASAASGTSGDTNGASGIVKARLIHREKCVRILLPIFFPFKNLRF